jgi:2,4-dienoyl-CoA reductase-like NADH-dependent reductase (Old Yellow Enzyme family)/thioredoxin reductase
VQDPLLTPFVHRNLRLRNRIVSTSHEPAYSEDGMPKDRYRAYHVEKAKGGVGLTMIGGSAMVGRDTAQAFGNLTLGHDEAVPWLRQLTDEVHDHDTAVMIQLTHLGHRTSNYAGDWIPAVSASAVREPAHRAFARAAEEWDLDRICDDFVSATQRCVEAGLDGVELMAYGHFLDSFWTPFWNQREDEYNGELEDRLRYPLRVVRAVREALGPDRTLGIRMSFDEQRQGGLGVEEALAIAGKVTEAGVDLISIIRGSIETNAAMGMMIPPMGTPSAPHLDFAGRVRAEVGVPVMHAGRIADVATARHAINDGLLDLVGMTRALMADPHLPKKLASGAEDSIRPCVGAATCIDGIYVSGAAFCAHNASTGRELEIPHVVPTSPQRRNAVVVGAGPAGLEAARVLAERGHGVVVYEAAGGPGGQLALAAHSAPRRRDLIGIVEWRRDELKRLGVTVHYDHYVAAEDVRDADIDLVIVATGGLPTTPAGLVGAELVTDTWDVLSGAARISGDVLVYDDHGGNAALDAAERLAGAGSTVEVVSPERGMSPDVGAVTLSEYTKALAGLDVRMTVLRRLLAVRRSTDGRLECVLGVDLSDVTETRIVDAVVVEHGTAPAQELYDELVPLSSNGGAVDYDALLAGTEQRAERNADGRFKLYRIGDAVASRNVPAAILDAARLCQTL